MDSESVETVRNDLETEAGDEHIDILNAIDKCENLVEVEGSEGEHREDDIVENGILDNENVKDRDIVEGEFTDKENREYLLDEQEKVEVNVTEPAQDNIKDEQKLTGDGIEEIVEPEAYIEEPPPDPSAPYDLSDSKEDLKEPFELRPDQLAEIEQLWNYYQNYTPIYTDIDQYVTKKELVYMLKSLLLMTYTFEQLQELVDFCVRPPHPQGHISYNQFLMMVKIRQRDFPVEEELRSALQVLDPERTGNVDRERLKELLATKGHKMPQKQLDNLVKEVDMSNDGTIGIEDVVGTMCVDLNKEDIQMLRDSLNPKKEENTYDRF